MLLLSVYTAEKFYTSYTHRYIHHVISTIHLNLPKFGRNVVFYHSFLLSNTINDGINQPMDFNCSHHLCFTSDHIKLKQFTIVLGLCLNWTFFLFNDA